MRRDLASRGYGHCVVGGRSMLPLLRPGDIVRIERRGHVRRGDIVAVMIAGTSAIHRVAHVSADGVVCCGDNCRRPDPIVPPSAVYGLATMLLPGRRLRGGRGAYVAARLRFYSSLMPAVARTVGDEIEFLVRQSTSRPLPERRYLRGGPRDPRDDGCVTLDPETAVSLLGVGVGSDPDQFLPAGADVEIPAGVFSGMAVGDRRRVLAALRGRKVVVWASLARRPILRVTGVLRSLLAMVGLSAGQPGDATVRGPYVGWRPLHYFTPQGLAAELTAAGGRQVETAVVTTLGGGGYVRATAQL